MDDIDAGAKIPRGCMSFHIPSESFDIENVLRSKGFSGTRPSIWVFQVNIWFLGIFFDLHEVLHSFMVLT